MLLAGFEDGEGTVSNGGFSGGVSRGVSGGVGGGSVSVGETASRLYRFSVHQLGQLTAGVFLGHHLQAVALDF